MKQTKINALHSLGLRGDAGLLVKEETDRRQIFRYDNKVLKLFSETERAAWQRELAGFEAIVGCGLGPDLVGSGDLWLATRWIDGETPLAQNNEGAHVHRILGQLLTRLQSVPADNLQTWPLEGRLKLQFANFHATVPAELSDQLVALADSWLPHIRQDTFVHGDWGTANILVSANVEVLALIDFEDSQIGDSTEDFRWQAFAGPTSHQLESMLSGFKGNHGPNASERLALATLELCLEVLDWDERMRSHSLKMLDRLANGWLPPI